MTYSVAPHATHRLIDVRYRGNVSIAERSAAHEETRVLLVQTGFLRILIDYTDAQPTSEPFATTAAFVNRISSDPLLRPCKIAFVGQPAQFFNVTVETLADVRHYPFKRFYDRSAALEWLDQQPG